MSRKPQFLFESLEETEEVFFSLEPSENNNDYFFMQN